MSSTYAGSFSGSGAGVVQLGNLSASGLTLDITGIGAQWTSNGSLTGTLTNAGSIVVDSGVTVYQGSESSSASIVNQAGATFDLQGTADLSNAYTNGYVYNDGTFTNAGTLEQSTGTGTATLAYALNNSATLNAVTGTLALSGGGTWSGATSIGGTVALTGNTLTLNAGASIAPSQADPARSK